MGEFRFGHPVTICGETYWMDIGRPEVMTRFGEEVGKSREAKNAEEALNIIKESIDILLGEGATDSIFQDRIMTYGDLWDLITFLSDELSREKERRDETLKKTAVK